MIRTLLFVLFVGVIVIGIIMLIVANKDAMMTPKKKGVITVNDKTTKKKNLVGGIISVAGLVLTILVPPSFHQVEAGQVAVVKSLGKVVGTRHPGTYFDFHLVNEYTYFDTTIQKLDVSTASYSSDAQTMEIQMTIQYKIDATKAENILTEYTNMTSLAQRIEKVADDNVKTVLSQYTAMKIIETRAKISPEVESVIKNEVDDKYYVTVTAVNLTDIQFTDEFEKSVENKVIAEQEKEAAITKAEQELEVAKLEAEAKIVAAQGDAESQKIIASASAEAMAIKIVELAKSLGFKVTESYIQKIETVTTSSIDNSLISSSTIEEEVTTYPNVGVKVTKDETNNTITTVTTTLENTKYVIEYDAEHTEEDLKVVLEFVQYLEYLEKWDGKLPTVITGSEGVEIIIPSPDTSQTTN